MHHAYLYSDTASLPDLSKEDPADFISETHATLPIGVVRSLSERVYLKPVGESGKRATLIVADAITVEAQNALLKILEEPPVHTTFHFVISDQSRLLPTLQSRFEHVATSEKENTDVARSFITMTIAERISQIETKTKEKDTKWQQELLRGLAVLAADGSLEPKTVEALLFVEQRIAGPGASPKMLLEHLALSLQ